jgi:hypothetical protein
MSSVSLLASPSSVPTLACSSGTTSSPVLAVTAPSALSPAPAPLSSSVAALPFRDDRFLSSSSLGDADAHAAAHVALLARMFYSAGIVPMNYRELAQKMISGGIADESNLHISLDDDPGLLVSLYMKVAQQSCLIRYNT